MNRFRNILYGFVLAALTSQATAVTQTVNFFSFGGGHFKAGGVDPLGHETFIELGAFNEGFEPTFANRGDWKANWHTAKRIAYNVQEQNFDGILNIDDNNAPFTTSNKVWVWVFDRSGNWALYSNAGWFWPDTSGPGFPLECTLAAANIQIVGTTSASNPKLICQLVTDAPSPAVTYTQWADLLLPEGSRGKTTDYDGDGQNNLTEYALGSDATDRSSVSAVVQVRSYSSQNYLSAKISKGSATGITYTVQWSDNLSNWYDTGLTTVADTATLLEVRDPNPIGTATKRFMRVLIESPD